MYSCLFSQFLHRDMKPDTPLESRWWPWASAEWWTPIPDSAGRTSAVDLPVPWGSDSRLPLPQRSTLKGRRYSRHKSKHACFKQKCMHAIIAEEAYNILLLLSGVMCVGHWVHNIHWPSPHRSLPASLSFIQLYRLHMDKKWVYPLLPVIFITISCWCW